MERSALESIISWDKSVIATASLVVAVGLIGECKKDISRVWGIYWNSYPITLSVVIATINGSRTLLFRFLVVLGVAVEWLYEADVSIRESAYTILLDNDNTRLASTAQAATERAAKTAKQESDLLKENIELEKALASRDFNQAALPAALKDLSRVPIVIESLKKEEPQELSGYMQFAFTGIRFGDAAPW